MDMNDIYTQAWRVISPLDGFGVRQVGVEITRNEDAPVSARVSVHVYDGYDQFVQGRGVFFVDAPDIANYEGASELFFHWRKVVLTLGLVGLQVAQHMHGDMDVKFQGNLIRFSLGMNGNAGDKWVAIESIYPFEVVDVCIEGTHGYYTRWAKAVRGAQVGDKAISLANTLKEWNT